MVEYIDLSDQGVSTGSHTPATVNSPQSSQVQIIAPSTFNVKDKENTSAQALNNELKTQKVDKIQVSETISEF